MVADIEERLHALLDRKIASVAELEAWLAEERTLRDEVTDLLTRHKIDFYRDTANAEKRRIYLEDQSALQPLLAKDEAELDRKFCDSPFADRLDEGRYGLLRKVRRTKLALFREANIPLAARERELVMRYHELMGGLTVQWDGEAKPLPYVQARAESPDRAVRERAWRAMAAARGRVKPEIDEVMSELVRLRHQMALNAGFANYRDYMFVAKYREYTVQDCYDLHQAVEQHIVPAWDRLAELLRAELGAETFRPWDMGHCTLPGAPYATDTELIDGVEAMLGRTDPEFQAQLRSMREQGLLDLEVRPGKRQGAFFDLLPAVRAGFIFENFSPSFVALIALIHEFGHAIQGYRQYETAGGMQEHNHREEVGELFSHSLELLTLDKLDQFYGEERAFRNAQREELHRTFDVLINPLVGDMFQHWLYTHPDHTPAERDAEFLALNRRFSFHPVDIAGLEAEVAASWIRSVHTFAYPFYRIEYAMSMLGALQLLAIYREDPAQAVALYKRGAGADLDQSIAEIYRDAGIAFDFSAETVSRTARFVEGLIRELG